MSDFASVRVDEHGQLEFGGGDARLWVRFSRRARKNAFRSEQEGRPIYEQVDYIQIQQPGERDQLVRPVKEEDKLRFPKQWSAYQNDAEQVPEGTPVGMLFPNEPQIVEMLRDLKVVTVEQLSQLTEQGIHRLGMDGRKYVARALAALKQAENTKEVNRLERVVSDLTDRVKVLESANKRLADERDELREQRAEADDRPRARNRPRVFDPPPEAPPPLPPAPRTELVPE